jgi:M6 family metalloprotease-like protein
MRPRSRLILPAVLLAVLAGLPAFALPAAPADDALRSWRAERRSALRARSLDGAKSTAAAARFGLLVIPVDFSDHRLPDGWNAAALAPRLGAAGGQSLRHYFDVASAGRCELVCLTAPLVHLPGAALDYSDLGRNGFTRTRRLASEALTAVAAAGFDFRQADLDGPDRLAGGPDDDGWVDGVLILHAEAGQENDPAEGLIQALQYYLETPVSADGISAGPYAVASLSSGPGIWAHETAHLLGLEDRYDPLLPPTDGAGDMAGSGGLGVFSLMAAGAWGTGGGWAPALPDAYSRAQVGWCEVVAIETGAAGGDTLLAAPAGAVAHRVWTRGEAGPEFFLLEARDPAAAAPFDAALPAAGLVVLHVDEGVPEGGWSEDGFQQWHLRARLVEADGDDNLREGRDTGAAGDVFPGAGGVGALTPSTAPASDGYGGPSEVAITDIAAVAGGVRHRVVSAAAPWLSVSVAFAEETPRTLQSVARVHGGQAAALSLRIEALGDPAWGAFAGGARLIDVALQADADGDWTPLTPPVWQPDLDLPPDACTTFRATLSGPGLATLVTTRPWCWTGPDETLDFARSWPGQWILETPDGPGTAWQRWTGAHSLALDGSPVLVCTGAAVDPAAWPAVSYTNGGRALLTSGPLAAGTGGVRLLHWVDVETLPGGVPMDGAVASWVGPDGVEVPAEPLNGWPARVDATSGSALRGRGAFGEPHAERDEAGRPLWRTDIIPVPATGVGPWRLRLELAANALWRARGWVVARCEAIAAPASFDERLTWDGDLSWGWHWPTPGGNAPAFTLQARTLPDSTWNVLLAEVGPVVAGADILSRLTGSPGTRHELRVTGPTAWGLLALAPVSVYVDGGAGGAPALDVPWPNPATGSLRFTLQVPEGSTGHLRIYDLRGRLVHAREAPPGTHFGEWDGRDDQGRRLASGAYLLKFDGAGAPVTRKVVLQH